MNKANLIRKVTDVLRENGAGKTVKFPKYAFHIEDDGGNKKDFYVRKSEKLCSFNAEDVSVILDAIIAVAEDSIKSGEAVSIHGFGKIGVKMRKKHKTKIPFTDQWVDIDAHYVPYFVAGDNLKMCAKMYEVSLSEKIGGVELPVFDDDEIGGEEDGN